MTTTDTTHPAASHALQCLEVWGGSQAIKSGISVPGIDAWITSTPFDHATHGGDIHYVSMCGAGRISRFVLCDVTGHGTAVAGVAARLRALMRKYIGQIDQTKFARRISEDFLELERNGHFATSILMTYFAPTDQLIVLNAGHPRPLWYRRKTNQWVFFHPGLAPASESTRNLPLGVVEDTEFVQFAVQLEPGDLVLAYTDALTESRDAADELLGEDGLMRMAQSLEVSPPETFTDRLLNEIARRQSGNPLTDDQTVLLLHHTATDPPEQSIGEKLHVLGRMLRLPW